MRAQVNIDYEQLVKLVKQLPFDQWVQLKKEVEATKTSETNSSDMEELLLAAPTFSEEQLDEIAKTREAINQWRSK